MKNLGSMTLDDVEKLLTEASRLSNHRLFVVAGSLSALGAIVTPPPDMVMSLDLDFYPKLDPERGFFEISKELGIDSAYAKANRFYADPISPNILALPEGWHERLIPISFPRGLVAYFLEPADAGISKLIRGADNDVRWVRAGLKENIFTYDLLSERAADVPSASDQEMRRCRRIIFDLSHEASQEISASNATFPEL